MPKVYTEFIFVWRNWLLRQAARRPKRVQGVIQKDPISVCLNEVNAVYKKYIFLFAIIFFTPFLISCSSQTSCLQNNNEYAQSINDIINRWDDETAELVNQKSNANDLLNIRKEISEINPPECAADAHFLLQLYMDVQLIGVQDELQKAIDNFPNYAPNFRQIVNADVVSARSIFDEAWAELDSN